MPSCLVHSILGSTTRCATTCTEQVREEVWPAVGDPLTGDMDTTGAGRAVERGMAVYVTGTTECTCSLWRTELLIYLQVYLVVLFLVHLFL